MSAKVVLRPGRTPLADWRVVFDGAALELDPIAQADVEAGRAALTSILSQNGLLPPLDIAGASPSVAEMIETRGEPLPEGHLRLLLGLKLTALAQGVSGVRWEVVEALADLLANDLLPVVPVAADDRLAMSHLFGALTGAGEILYRGRIRPSTDLLREAELSPLSFNPRERSALLSGSELTLATALARLFDAERIVHAAIVATALAEASSGRPDPMHHPSVHRLHRQRGQIDVATTLRTLLDHKDEEADAAALENSGASAAASVVFRMGAALDLLRQAGAILERTANGVSEDRLVLWQTAEMVSGVDDPTAVALATDLIALSLTTLGDLVAKGISGDNAAAKAAALATANRERAGVPALDPATMGRLDPMLATASEIVAVALLGAARAAEPIAAGGLADVHRFVTEIAPYEDATAALTDEEVGKVAERIRSGALAAQSGVSLPTVAPVPPARPARRLGGRRNRP